MTNDDERAIGNATYVAAINLNDVARQLSIIRDNLAIALTNRAAPHVINLLLASRCE